MEIQSLIFLYLIIILSAVFHEYAHGFVAEQLGDPTARYAGRLTLNPIPHIDPWGTVIVPLFLMLTAGIFIGWAKPVPYNPYNLRAKHGSLWVGLAGPGSNFILALIIGLAIRFFNLGTMQEFFFLVVQVNVYLALFNLLPLPPLDGSKVFAEFFPEYLWSQYVSVGIIIALLSAFFILPPIADFVIRLIIGT